MGIAEKYDHEFFIGIIAATIIFFLLIGFTIIQLFLYQRKQHQNTLKLNEMQVQYAEAILHTQLEIQEQTFKTISQEIHDNIGQVLSLAKLNLNTIDLSKETAGQKVGNAKELLSKAINDLRDLSKTLNTETIADTGLWKAIQQELQLLEKAETIVPELSVSGIVHRFDPQKELILFRIVQEAINNIIKHSHADTLQVTASFSPGLELIITDNGNGFTPLPDNEGSGLRNMKSRARLIGAELSIQSNDSGTSIHIALPI